MALRQLNIAIPEALYRDLQHLVPAGERTRFIAQLTENGLRHLKLQRAAEQSFGVWAKHDHPELARGSHAYVRGLRTGRRSRAA
jgi:hypothetical protein